MGELTGMTTEGFVFMVTQAQLIILAQDPAYKGQIEPHVKKISHNTDNKTARVFVSPGAPLDENATLGLVRRILGLQA